MKNFTLGMLVAIVLALLLGAKMPSSYTSRQMEIYRDIADRFGKLILVSDKNGDYIVVNVETAEAEYVEYSEPRPARAVRSRSLPEVVPAFIHQSGKNKPR